jgi:hypothetical protein
MSSHIFQAVWPILDGRVTNRDLIAEATTDLMRLAAQAHARLIGPPVWAIHPAAEVPGFHAHAPGRVLIARAPAVPAPALRPLQAAA